MRIAVISDTHGDTSWMNRLKPMFDSVDCVIHLGDVVSDARKIEENVKCPVYYVAGNCDMLSSAPQELNKYIGGKKIFAVHGNGYSLDYGLYSLSAEAREKEADICLYGHTHVPDITTGYGIWFVNPGSISRPRGIAGKTYAVIEIKKNGEIIPDIISL